MLIYIVFAIIALVGILFLYSITLSKQNRETVMQNDAMSQQNHAIIQRNDEIIQRNNKIIEQSKKNRKRYREDRQVIKTLSAYAKRNVFTKSEEQEIAQLMKVSTDLTEQCIKLVNQLTKLTLQKTSKVIISINDPAKNDAKIRSLFAEMTEIEKQLAPLDAEEIAIMDKIKNWLAIAEQRPDNYNQQLSEYPPSSPNPTLSVADELSKLKVLLDDGILTQEEFDHKKKKLLGM